MNATPSPLDRFQATVLADERLQLALAPINRPDEFAGKAVALAAAHGIALTTETILEGLHKAPRSPMAVDAGRTLGHAPPPRHWLPSAIRPTGTTMAVEWLHFAGAALDLPFFEESSQRARYLPFNRLFPQVTTIDALVDFSDSPMPDGLIFHMSRCGSTLVTHMLGAAPGHVAVSEPPPLDPILQFAAAGMVPLEAVRGMAAALTRDRGTGTRHRFLKLDSWHALLMPVIRAAFPGVPWVFLYRDPVEVLVSHGRMPGIHSAQGVLPPALFGGEDPMAVPQDDYPAWIIGQICTAMARESDAGGGLLVNYSELPDAVMSRIMPHFGITLSAPAQTMMAAVGQRDAKSPVRAFTPDSANKRAAASTAQQDAAERHARAPYDRLEMIRAAHAR